MPVDGTLHYLKMLEVIVAFGVVILSDNNLPGEMGKKQRCKGAEAGGLVAYRTWGGGGGEG